MSKYSASLPLFIAAASTTVELIQQGQTYNSKSFCLNLADEDILPAAGQSRLRSHENLLVLQYRQPMQKASPSKHIQKVTSICCYLCGREFQTKGYPFHYKNCLEKFAHEQKQRPTAQRIKTPSPPEGLSSLLEGRLQELDLRRFNQQASKIHKYKVLPGCKYCGRTFNFQSLPAHMKGCEKRLGHVEQKQNVKEEYKAPKSLVCCVCGQRFGTHSLKIHYPECLKKFKYDEFRKHKREGDRRKAPQFSEEDLQLVNTRTSWEDAEMEEFNNRATFNYRQHGMAECSNCGRRFFDEQLEKHRKNCVLINGVLNLGAKLAEKKEVEVRKPRTLMCLICGRDYGLTSIVIHLQNCKDLFQKQQKLKAKPDRKVVASLPEEKRAEYDLSTAQTWSSDKIQAYNKMVSDIYNTKSLAKCYICQRTFFEQSLPKHMKACESQLKDVRKLQKFKKEISSKRNVLGENFLENVIEMNRQLNKLPDKDVQKPKVLMCYLCGRQYGLSSLKIHLPQCQIKQNHTQQAKKAEFEAIAKRINEKYDLAAAEEWSAVEIAKYNGEVYEIYKREALHECSYCHRTFYEEALAKHIKHCEKEAAKGKPRKLRRSQTMTALTVEEDTNEEIVKQLERSVADINKITSCELIVDEASELSEEDEVTDHILEEEYIRILDQEPMKIQGEQLEEEEKMEEMTIEELQPSMPITDCEPLEVSEL